MSSNWVGKPSPKSMRVGNGWFAEMNRAYSSKDGKYAVMTREVETDWGTVTHACIRNIEGTDICWSEKQRIKDELLGVERTAIEVFPKRSEVVDEANMYHLWVLPVQMQMPFSIKN
ncbi:MULTISPECIES: DUF7694 domain-containing protein [unclassified Paenibacillus]|uniref:DUF7694 domain-containing protein n=1 Tax=unclassified Paenibacillus TaxID=185978 RepID=UPI0009A63166|nr:MULTISPECIES: hypothetical protein [unclassified Paenibacillus]SLK16651.1 hypothetical protein SAMN06272722_110215 [Paenibacillus sp. RU5A]SOC74429.1 hypothetical protein SAMN05880581_110215 [Paenibacillus sp. RU26A]SOC76602.1 hypothetical protein SAMN05880586_110215 [Paenibacillus sp. RU5M]